MASAPGLRHTVGMQAPPRLVAGRALPPYAYVPGRHAHPTRDPAGHMSGRAEVAPTPQPAQGWAAGEAYLFGFDLFNHGYYWEAHEAWEALWHAAGRAGPVAALLNGLILLAAAGVKAREAMPKGVVRHAGRAVAMFGAAAAAGPALGGFRLDDLAAFAAAIAADPPSIAAAPGAPPQVVFTRALIPAPAPAAPP
jgi:uncharacterized protein